MWPILFPLTFRLSSVSRDDRNSSIDMCFYVGFAIVFAAVMGTYVIPVIGTFVIDPEGISLRCVADLRHPPPSAPSRIVSNLTWASCRICPSIFVTNRSIAKMDWSALRGDL